MTVSEIKSMSYQETLGRALSGGKPEASDLRRRVRCINKAIRELMESELGFRYVLEECARLEGAKKAYQNILRTIKF